MTIQSIFLKIIIIAILLIQIGFCQFSFGLTTPSFNTIFSPKQLYQNKLESSSSFKQLPVGTILLYNQTLSLRIVYVGLDDGTLQIFNFTNSANQNLVLNKRFSDNRNGKTLLTNKKQSILWFVKSHGIEIIDISSPLQPYLLQLHQINENEKQNYFLNIEYDFSETRVFILRQNGFDLFDIQRDFSLQQVQSIFEEGITTRSLKLIQNQTFTVSSANFKGFSIYSSPSLNSTSYSLNNLSYPKEPPVFNLLCRVVPNLSTNIIQLHTFTTYAFVLDEFKGFWIYDLSKVFKNNACGANPSTNEFVINTASQNWSYTTISFHVFSNAILILVVRSDIIMIFYNNPRNTIGRIQELDTKVITGKAFAFNSDQTAFSLAGESYVNIYIKVAPAQNRDYPNLLNIYQSSVNTKDILTTPQVGWQCYSSIYNLYTIRQYSGQFMFVSPNVTYFEQNNQFYPNPINQNDQGTSLKYINKFKVMVVGVKGTGLFFWNYTKVASPVFIGSNSLINNQQEPGVIESIRNETFLLVANGIVGLSFVNVTDILNTKHLLTSKFDVEDYSFSGVVATNDGNYAYASARFYGYIAINITNITNPIVMKRIGSRGGEKVTLSQDQNFLLVADATFGVSIVNITDRGTMQLISTTKLDSHVYRIKNYDNNYIVIAQRQEQLITLMDITNRTKPKVISKLQYPGLSDCYDICFSYDQVYLYAITFNGVLTMQTRTSIQVHSELAEIIFDSITNQISNYRRMEPTENLYIGMVVELSMVHYNPKSNLQFYNAFAFLNSQFSSLPPWITFYPQTRSFKIEVTASSLDISQIEHKGYLNIETSSQIFKSTFQIANLIFEEVLPNSFINYKLQITEAISIQIYNQCVEQGIITQQGFNTREYNLQAKIPFVNPDLTKPQLEYVRSVIRTKQIIYPVPITIASSLLYNNNPSQSLFEAQNYTLYNSNFFMQKKQGYVITNQPFVYFTLYLQDKNAKFVPRKYSGALVSISEEKDQIKIQGDHEAINEILQKQIQVFVNHNYTNQVQLQVRIEDQVNNPITIVDNLQKFTFISHNQPVLVNTEYTLQDDFSKRYDQNIIYIKTDFVYQINRQIFIDQDDQDTLIFQVKIIKSQDTLEDLKINSWLQYSSDDRKLYGTPDNENFGDSINIRVIASDGFTEAYQDITINVTGIPFTYLFSLVFTILSPILGFFSVWKLKYIAVNIFTKKKYSSPNPDIVRVGNVYYKQIPLVYFEIKDAEQVWKFISQNINVNKIKNDINAYQTKYKTNTQQNKDNLKNSQIFNSDKLNKMHQSQNVECIDQTKQGFLLNQEHSLSRSVSMQKSMNESQNLKIRKQATNTLKQIFVSHLKNQKAKHDNISAANEQFQDQDSFIQNDGSLNKHYIIKMCKNLINFNQKNQFIKSFQVEILLKLDNQSSCLSQFLFFKISEAIIKCHNETLQLYKYIKSIGVQECGEQEWYKAFTQIIPQFDHIFISSFPQIEIDNHKIQSSINQLHNQQSIVTQKSFTRKKSSTKLNFEEIQYLLGTINDQIIGSAYGFSFINNSLNSRVLGESIFEIKHNIATISAHEKRLKKNKVCFQSKFIPIGLFNNSKLPSWITGVDIINDTILIQGKPEQKDVGKVQIQIVDKEYQIAKQFEIQVIENDQQKQQQNQSQFSPIVVEKTAGDSLLTQSNILTSHKRNGNSPLIKSFLYNAESEKLIYPKKFELLKQSEIEINKTENDTARQMQNGEDEVNEEESALNFQNYIFSTQPNQSNN